MSEQHFFGFNLAINYLRTSTKIPTVTFLVRDNHLRWQIASSHVEAFNGLLDLYGEIGELLPLFQTHEELFSGDNHMSMILPMVYKDILEIHRLALDYFQKRFWKQLISATWKTFRSKFVVLIERMRRHRELVESHASLAQVRAFQNVRDEDENRHQDETRRNTLWKRRTVNLWLNGTNMDNEQHKLDGIRANYPRTGKWLFANETFKKWLDPKFPTLPTLLWLNGQPGAGELCLVIMRPELRSTTSQAKLFWLVIS